MMSLLQLVRCIRSHCDAVRCAAVVTAAGVLDLIMHVEDLRCGWRLARAGDRGQLRVRAGLQHGTQTRDGGSSDDGGPRAGPWLRVESGCGGSSCLICDGCGLCGCVQAHWEYIARSTAQTCASHTHAAVCVFKYVARRLGRRPRHPVAPAAARADHGAADPLAPLSGRRRRSRAPRRRASCATRRTFGRRRQRRGLAAAGGCCAGELRGATAHVAHGAFAARSLHRTPSRPRVGARAAAARCRRPCIRRRAATRRAHRGERLALSQSRGRRSPSPPRRREAAVAAGAGRRVAGGRLRRRRRGS